MHRYTLSIPSNKGTNGAACNCINVCLLNVVTLLL